MPGRDLVRWPEPCIEQVGTFFSGKRLNFCLILLFVSVRFAYSSYYDTSSMNNNEVFDDAENVSNLFDSN